MPKNNPVIIDYFNSKGALMCRCTKHDKRWPEGDEFEEDGGKACRICSNDPNIERIQEQP